MWHMTHDMWQMTHDTWHMTCDTWHVTCDMWHVKCCWGWTFSQKFSFLALTICDLWYYEVLEQKADQLTLSQLVSRNNEWITRLFVEQPGYTGSVNNRQIQKQISNWIHQIWCSLDYEADDRNMTVHSTGHKVYQVKKYKKKYPKFQIICSLARWTQKTFYSTHKIYRVKKGITLNISVFFKPSMTILVVAVPYNYLL